MLIINKINKQERKKKYKKFTSTNEDQNINF